MSADDAPDPDPSGPSSEHADTEGEYGPGGYLPARAAKRARKIVLREQMGIHWPIAAVVAGVLIVLITLPLVIAVGGGPAESFVDIGPLVDIPPNSSTLRTVESRDVLVVRADGALSAFVDPPPRAEYCLESRRIEDASGRAWTNQGRLIVGDGESLSPADVTAFEGNVFVDVTSTRGPLPPRQGEQELSC